MTFVRKRNKSLGLPELIAIALGGMVGGGIFTILGISVSLIGSLTPIAIIIGGIVASMAAYSYVKLGLYYKDEGATYSFYKKTYKNSHFSASAIGWFITFGYISTLALYAYTFSSYTLSSTEFATNEWARKIVAIAIIGLFVIINLWSVKGMGRVEDLMVYLKLVILALVSVFLIIHGNKDINGFLQEMKQDFSNTSLHLILIVSAITFVAYEGFQLVIHAMNEMENPEKNIPRAIYSAIVLAILIYVIIATGALFAIPAQELIDKKEYALAAGASEVMGPLGASLVIAGAILATSSAISGTVFGSSRLMAVIAEDGYLPKLFAKRRNFIPHYAILAMFLFSSILILIGGLQLLLEFGSITFLLVSFLMAVANHKIRDKTKSSSVLTIVSIIGLGVGGVLILYYEFMTNKVVLIFSALLYFLLALGAWFYAKKQNQISQGA